MENNDLLGSQLQVDNVAANHLADMAKWGRFISIVGFILCILFVIAGITVSTFLSQVTSGIYGNAFSGLGPSLGVVYVLMALLYFFPCLFLFRFSTKMKTALLTADQQTFNDALSQHRRRYKFVGILTILLLCFYALALVIAVIGGAMR